MKMRIAFLYPSEEIKRKVMLSSYNFDIEDVYVEKDFSVSLLLDQLLEMNEKKIRTEMPFFDCY